jgi:hypothetical protein
MAKFHGNNKKNPKLYHLYEIVDKETDDIFKYGISGDEISPKDNLSKRVREQVALGNLFVGWLRYFGRIVVKNIKGNAEARVLENQYIEIYFDENGDYPIGNRDRMKK